MSAPAGKNPWIRLYRESLHDPKIVVLSDRQHRAWHNCLLIADDTGTLPAIRDIAVHMRMSVTDAEQMLVDLVEAELIDAAMLSGSRTYRMHGWAKQARRPSSEVWAALRALIFKRDDYTCGYCGERGKRLECDHVVPVARGGGNGADNLITACFRCNRSKRAKLPSEWRRRAQ